MKHYFLVNIFTAYNTQYKLYALRQMKKFFTTQKANLVGNLESWFNFATPPFEPKNLGDFNIT